jgi:NDP-sugar pyrophosphorylase family protein
VPKPMAPFQGSTLIAQGMRSMRKYVPNVHITVGYKKAMLAEHVIQEGAATVINTEGQSNAWWIFNSLAKYIDEPIFVLTCDNVTELDFGLLERNYFALNEPACMVVPVRPVSGLEGDYIFHDEGNFVQELNRNKPAPTYCSGIQVLNPAKVNRLALGESDFYGVWNSLIAKRQLMVSEVYPKKWISIDTFDQLVKASGA